MGQYSARLPQSREEYRDEAAMGAQKASVPPWEGLDRNAKPKGNGFRLHLNEYQKRLLEAVARKHLGSQHNTALRLLVRALETDLGLKEGQNGAK